MGTISLYCEETPELKLGPGTTGAWPGLDGRPDRTPGNVIVFARGFAEFDEQDYPDWKAWVAAPGTPYIRVIDESTGEGLAGDAPHICLIDGRPFKSELALNGHMRSHTAKGAAQ